MRPVPLRASLLRITVRGANRAMARSALFFPEKNGYKASLREIEAVTALLWGKGDPWQKRVQVEEPLAPGECNIVARSLAASASQRWTRPS